MASFCLDENVAADVGSLLERHGHNVLSLTSVPALRRIDDYDVLRIAARESRILVTQNANDFTLLHHAWRRWPREWGIAPVHAGILVPLQRLALSPAEIVFHVDELLATGWPLENELYLFKGSRGGWVRAFEPPEPGHPGRGVAV